MDKSTVSADSRQHEPATCFHAEVHYGDAASSTAWRAESMGLAITEAVREAFRLIVSNGKGAAIVTAQERCESCDGMGRTRAIAGLSKQCPTCRGRQPIRQSVEFSLSHADLPEEFTSPGN